MESKTRLHRILIIDDSRADRDLYRRLIARGSEADYSFWETDSGEEGLRLYRSQRPDCVVLDYQLPDLNGLEFLARLQAEQGEEPAPVIMLTGRGNEMVAVQALRMGAQDYLVKNRSDEGLRKAVQAVMGRATLRRQIDEHRRKLDQGVEVLRESEERYRLMAAQALRESEERYQLLLEGVVDYAIIMLDRGGHVVSWNAGAERLFGYRAAEIVGKHISSFSPPEIVQQGHPQHQLHLATDQGRCQCDEWRIRKDGSRFWAHITVTALRDESGALWGFANVTRDITER